MSVSQFEAAQGRVDGLERKLAQEVDTLRGEISSVKEDVSDVKVMTAQGFENVLAKLEAMKAPAPAISAPDPSGIPLPSEPLSGGKRPRGIAAP